MVTRSGLWHQQYAEEGHDPAFLPELKRLVEEHGGLGSAGTRTNPGERETHGELTGTSLAGRRIFVLCRKGCNARGFATKTGFTVLEGSVARGRWAPSHIRHNRTYFTERERLVEDGILVRRSGAAEEESFRFAKDHTFNSATQAGFVCAGDIDNLHAWKNEETGRSLKEERDRKGLR